MMHNPFYHRGAIRHLQDFFGREAETAQILGLLANGQSVSLIGPRRIGKSSLLLHLSRDEIRSQTRLGAREALFITIDSQELGGSPPEEVYEIMLDGLCDAGRLAGIDVELPNRNGSYRALDRVLNKIAHAGIPVVVLLDEFELLAANQHLTPYFFARLRGLTTKYGLAFLTSSQRPLFSITASEEILSSPFFNIFVTLSLGEFSREEARGLLASRLDGFQLQFSDSMIAFLLDLAGNHPFFLHIAGYHAFHFLSHGEGEDFEQIEKAIEMEAASHMGYLWQNLSEGQQYALAVLDGPVDVMRALEQQCLVKLDVSGHGFQYPNELLRRFVRRQSVPGLVQASPFIIDLQRHKVFADGLELELTTSQFDLFQCLAQQAGQVVSAGDLERAVWGEALLDDPDRLKTLIKRLRRAIEPFDSWIVSERGVGYALQPPD